MPEESAPDSLADARLTQSPPTESTLAESSLSGSEADPELSPGPNSGLNPRPDPRPDSALSESEETEFRAQLVQAKKKALDLLSRREHTRHEIREKLVKHDYQDTIVETVLEYLQTKNFQCDRRFATAFAEQRAARGYGQHSIKASLTQRGVASDDARDALESVSQDWTSLAISVLRKKMPAGSTLSADRSKAYKEKAKYARFLQSRGFSTSEINTALATLETANTDADYD